MIFLFNEFQVGIIGIYGIIVELRHMATCNYLESEALYQFHTCSTETTSSSAMLLHLCLIKVTIQLVLITIFLHVFAFLIVFYPICCVENRKDIRIVFSSTLYNFVLLE